MKLQAILFTALLLFNCKGAPEEKPEAADHSAASTYTPETSYPDALQKVFEAHGGLKTWKGFRTLSYEMPGDDGAEVHTIDLHKRFDKIEGPSYALGYDGRQVWIDTTAGSYDGDPVFHHNLMFYFYAMPFVLADDGILYGETEAIEFEGKTYPGIRIAYESGVGASPKDEYYLYYDPETHQMAWLGYTVTYFNDAPSSDVHWIRYNDWVEVDGLLLPNSLSWYDYEDGSPTAPGNYSATFKNARLSVNQKSPGFYDPPAHAEIAGEKPKE